MSLAGLLASVARDAERDTKPRLSHIGQVARLKEFLTRYQAPNTVAVGDLVTPRADSDLKGAGDPFLVVEVADPPLRSFDGKIGGYAFGRPLNVKVARIEDGIIGCVWVDHVSIEPFTGDGSRYGDIA